MTTPTHKALEALREAQQQVNHLLADLTLTEIDGDSLKRYRPIDNLMYSNLIGALCRWHTDTLKIFDELSAEAALSSELSQQAEVVKDAASVELKIYDAKEVLGLMANHPSVKALDEISEKLTIMLASAQVHSDGEEVTGYTIKTGALHSIIGILVGLGVPVEVPLPASAIDAAIAQHAQKEGK